MTSKQKLKEKRKIYRKYIKSKYDNSTLEIFNNYFVLQCTPLMKEMKCLTYNKSRHST